MTTHEDWPGDTEPLPHAAPDARLDRRLAELVGRTHTDDAADSWQTRGVQYVYRLWLSEHDSRPLTRHERNYLVACLMGGNAYAEAVRVPAVGCHGRRGYATQNLACTRVTAPGSGRAEEPTP